MNFEHPTFRGLDWYEKYGWEKGAIYIIGTRARGESKHSSKLHAPALPPNGVKLAHETLINSCSNNQIQGFTGKQKYVYP